MLTAKMYPNDRPHWTLANHMSRFIPRGDHFLVLAWCERFYKAAESIANGRKLTAWYQMSAADWEQCAQAANNQ